MWVYLIENLINGKKYVGQHCKYDLNKYLKWNVGHALRGDRDKPRLYNAIRKYGPENFSIRPLCYCNDKEQMDTLEKVWIAECDSTNPDLGYNIAFGGGGTIGVIPSSETRAKISKSVSQTLIGNKRRLGTTHPIEVRKQMSINRRGEKNAFCKLSDDECLEMIRLRNQGYKLKDLADKFNICVSSVVHITRGQHRSYLQERK